METENDQTHTVNIDAKSFNLPIEGLSQTAIQDLINQLEEPRISTCSVFTYSISHNSELAFLLRCKKTDSKQIGMYSCFGTTLRENEPNILFSAARSLITKSAGLLVKSEHQNLSDPLEVKRIAKEQLSKVNIDIYTNPKIQEVLKEFSNNQLSIFMQVFGGSHLAIFLPIKYFQVETVNIVLSEEFDGTKLQDVSFHWVPLSQLNNPEFTQKYISAFNFQIISYCADLITKNLFNDKFSSDINKLSSYADIAVLKTDGRQNLDHIYETMARGEWICGQKSNDQIKEKWSFFNVYDFDYPCEAELMKLRVIIIPGSPASVLDLDKTPWISNLSDFIRKVFVQFKNIKLLGVCFGCQIIAKALGGEVDRLPQKTMYIGKEFIDLKQAFLMAPYFKLTVRSLGRSIDEKALKQIRQSLSQIAIFSVHGDHVSVLPEQGTLLASSKRCENEIWSIGNQVFCIQTHPEFNQSYIQQVIIDKLYDSGKIDDAQKKEAETQTMNNQVQLNRHFINKVIYQFLNQ